MTQNKWRGVASLGMWGRRLDVGFRLRRNSHFVEEKCFRLAFTLKGEFSFTTMFGDTGEITPREMLAVAIVVFAVAVALVAFLA